MSKYNRQDFQWRPNDNSSQTRMRYDLEANHWLKSLSGSVGSGSGGQHDWGSTFFVIGMIIHFVVTLILLILTLISDFIVWIVDLFHEKRERDREKAEYRPIPKPIEDEEEVRRIAKKCFEHLEELQKDPNY